jgi:hypothetical protein
MPLLSGLKQRPFTSTNGFYDRIQSTQIIFFTLKMETVYIKTPLGIAAITGDVNGVLK